MHSYKAISGPWNGVKRKQRPFKECMGDNRYKIALREERRSQEEEEWLEKNLYQLLFKAYKKARLNGRNSYSQVRFEMNLAENLDKLKKELLNGTYRPSRCIIFTVSRPVKREVIAPAFRDQVIDHLLYDYLAPIFEPLFIYDSYSCRLGKGTSFGIERLEHHIRSASNNYTRDCYVLQLDLTGYFMSIVHNVLYDQVSETLLSHGHRRDMLYPLAMYLIRIIIYTDPTVNCYIKGKPSDWNGLPASKSYFNCKPGTGLPIGKLTSQLFSNINLSPIDNLIKRLLKVKHYGRYVDDMYFVTQTKKEALQLIPAVTEHLNKMVRQRVHPHKVRIQEARKGVSFLGAVVRPGGNTLTHRAEGLMADNLSNAFAHEENPYIIESKIVSCQGHIKGRKSRRIESMIR